MPDFNGVDPGLSGDAGEHQVQGRIGGDSKGLIRHRVGRNREVVQHRGAFGRDTEHALVGAARSTRFAELQGHLNLPSRDRYRIRKTRRGPALGRINPSLPRPRICTAPSVIAVRHVTTRGRAADVDEYIGRCNADRGRLGHAAANASAGQCVGGCHRQCARCETAIDRLRTTPSATGAARGGVCR